MKVAFLGATKGIGRALARLLAERGEQLCLLGRNTNELERSARDLEARHPNETTIPIAICNLADTKSFAPALSAATRALGDIDTVIVTAGQFASQEDLEKDGQRALSILTLNFTNTVAFCEEARKRLLNRGGGTLCVFSSVAGERGRKPVVLYGSSKAGLSAYLEGLDHKFWTKGLRTICVKPGFVRTGMTSGLKPPPFAGTPAPVARDVLRAIDRGIPVVYTPRIWRYLMLIIRILPRAIMRRISY